MLTYMTAGMVTVLALIVTMIRIDLRKSLGFATPIDLTFTALMLYMFHGTFSGIVVAAFAGLFMSLSLSALSYVVGYQKCKVVRFHWTHGPEVEWIDVAPRVKYSIPCDGRSLVNKLSAIRTWLSQTA